MLGHPLASQIKVVRIQFDADTVSAPTGTCQACCAAPHKRIEDDIAHKREHSDQALRKLERIRRGMMGVGCAAQVGPYLSKPGLIVLRADNAEKTFLRSGFAVSARFPLHKHKLDIVFDHCVGLIRLSEKSARPRDFIFCIGNLVPDDGREVVEANGFTAFLYGGMKRNDRVPAVVFPSR